MSSAESDDEEETVLLQSVSNYYFEDDQKEPMAFSVLPIQWSENEPFEETKIDVFLRGTSDGGLLTIHKPVIAWKFDISNVGNLQISVLTKDKLWLTLEKPKKSFEHVIQSILVTIHCLHCVRRNPDLSEKSLWDQLRKIFSSYEEKPSPNDLVDHYGVINEAVKRDLLLAKSKFLLKLLEEKPKKRKLFDEEAKSTVMSGFIVEDVEDDVINETEVDESDEDEDDPFDSVCAFCDNGGELLCCDGKCLRSFHATVEAGEESQCESLGLSQQQVSDMQSFLCKNCQYKQYQCFACGKLGAFDHPSGSEVFRCANATCGHFYHPDCVAKLLHDGDETAADDLAKKIAGGESFACPIHKCCVCNLVEDKKITELQFAVCRRCPKSYHRKCLPRDIFFEDEGDEDTIARAWNGLLPHRALIYCLEHEIDDDLRTPIRDHIKFPDTEEKVSMEEREKRKSSALPLSKDKGPLKKRSLGGESSCGSSFMKASKQLARAAKEGQTAKKCEKVMSGQGSVRKIKSPNTTKKPVKESAKTASVVVDGEHKASLGEQLLEFMNKGSEPVKPGKQDIYERHPKKNGLVRSTSKKLSSEMTSLDGDSEKRLLALIQEAASSITYEQITDKHKPPSTHSYSLKAVVEKITMGKIEVSTEAVQTAIKKLEKASTIEDAKAVCGPDILDQIFKWQNKLRVYLAPFLHGMRYTSFGRHFTKVEKLQEIVDKLHWYIEDGDMIVDFCCGANDFSVLMSRKIEKEGKKCSYKNYDAMPPKRYFNFEQRDWMEVKRRELPDGSKLVMGLNPPFGVKAALANKFINKALEFKPKLLILIVPRETERLDLKKKIEKPYELVWEDLDFLSGKSFYLPGSVDVNDKAMDQCNNTPPPLYLWSRTDWAAKHKMIAKEQGHLSMQLKDNAENGASTSGKSPKERSPHRSSDSGEQDSQVQTKNQAGKLVGTKGFDEEKTRKEMDGKSGSGQVGETVRKRKHGAEKQDRTDKCDPTQSNDTPRKKRHGEKIDGKGSDARSPGHGPLGAMPPVDKCQVLPRRSPSSVRPSRSPTEVDGEKGGQHLEHTAPSPHFSHAQDRTSPKYTVRHPELPHCSPSSMRPSRSPADGFGDKSNRQFRHTAPSPHASRVHHGTSPEHSIEKHQGLPRHSPSSVRPSVSPTKGEKRSQNFEQQGWSQHFSYAHHGTSYSDRGRYHDMNNDDPCALGTQSMFGGVEGYGNRPYISGLQRESNVYAHAHLYGQGPEISAQRNSRIGSLSSPLHGGFGASMAPESSYGWSPPPVPQFSTMQRYAPRLDELNYTVMGNPAARPPMMSNYYDQRATLDPRVPQPGFRPESMGFARGPHNPQPHHSSAGWLNE